MPLLALLLPVLLGHIGLHAAILAVTLPQWITIAGEILKATPEVIKLLRLVHPVFVALHNELEKGQPPGYAARTAHDFMRRNAEAAIRVQDGMPK